MADKPAGEKSEKPTAKRLKESRAEGQIARTNDLGGYLVLLAATWLLPLLLQQAHRQGRALLTGMGDVVSSGSGDLLGVFGAAVVDGLLLCAPLVLTALVVGVLSQVAQIRWAPKKMKPNWKLLNVFTGIKGLLGPKLLWETAKNVAKLAAVVALSLGPTREVWEVLVAGGTGVSVIAMGRVIAEASLALLRSMALLGLVIAAADYLASKRRIDKQVKMTKQEVKEESKQTEGDPHVKGQIRARQMAMSRNRMMAEVPRADVVLVNPTHIAVALRYDPLRGAPVVVAKGAGAVADRIREIAAESAVPVVRDIPLARTVYRICEVDGFIPMELYEATARILAFVYTLKARGRAAGTHQSPFATAHEALVDLPKPAPPRRRSAATTAA